MTGNYIDSEGIHIETLDEIKTGLADDLKTIYGDDINLDSNTPDGQAVNIFAVAKKDVLDLLVDVFNSFSPSNAIGNVLTQRAYINGIKRQGATHTQCEFSLVFSKAVSLTGLDSSDISSPPSGIYTIQDEDGNYFYLYESATITSPGTYSLNFIAKDAGNILVTASQSMEFVSIVSGVTSVSTPSTLVITQGIDEETDAELRLRREKSVSKAAVGYLEGLIAALEDLDGVDYAMVYENVTGATDSDGIPSHSIWAVVDGGSSADIADVIYKKRNGGNNTKGSTVVSVTRPDGSLFPIRYDVVSSQPLYLKFNATSINGSTIDETIIKDYIVSKLSLGVYSSVNANMIASLILEVDSNCLATEILLSNDNSTWLSIVSPTAKNYRLSLSSSNIAITVV